ncbi:MAG: sporulation protein [Propionibacteriaceae bacterium]|nr:sporulation protein [Propionibacteriaceae bacterium]
MISVEFETPEPFVVGQSVYGVATWDPVGVTRGRAFIITVGWRTEGRGDTDTGVIATFNIPFTSGQPTTVTTFPFQFQLPPDGPVTYHGKLLRVLWSVTARVDVSLAIDPKQSRDFVVSPRLL